MVVVVDLGEVTQLRLGQFVFCCQEAHLAGAGTQPAEAIGQQRCISAPDRPYQHR
jgi:hypothetical protein